MQNSKLYVQGLPNGIAAFYNLDGKLIGSSGIINGIAEFSNRANQISVIRLTSSSGKYSTVHYVNK